MEDRNVQLQLLNPAGSLRKEFLKNLYPHRMDLFRTGQSTGREKLLSRFEPNFYMIEIICPKNVSWPVA
jgi:hypothetical protein